MRIIFLSFILCLSTSANEYIALPQKDQEQYLKKLQKNVREVQTMACQFKQEKRLELFDDVFRLKGWAYIRKTPRSIRWEYAKPLKKVVLINNEDMQVYKWRKNKRKRIINPNEKYIKLAYEYILAFFEGDFSEARKRFTLSIRKNYQGKHLLVFTSSAELKKFIQRIEIIVAADQKTIERVLIYESEKNYTNIKFAKILHNVKLKSDVFTEIFIENFSDGIEKTTSKN
ncbi:LolA family protein [Candidatus Uabimicrobium amorphum]|uniref:Cell envelope biogenesis protein LolA n=1 Tax=Uabimicrobium amorphum TaxID=2596890 RepID=A0A5S9INK3_UABAM|nr:outer membrane lipoprotein carrier protein LolA [Candidatus Uabimicrobium amorphum]BBM85159.1 cell envelope biogenesis protein LolA [Candidatus Uabimicrobium amorphum]